MDTPEKKKRGHPLTLTPEVAKKICDAIRAGNYRFVAAAWAGIPKRTFRRWCEKGKTARSGIYKDFWHLVQEAEKAADGRDHRLYYAPRAATDDGHTSQPACRHATQRHQVARAQQLGHGGAAGRGASVTGSVV